MTVIDTLSNAKVGDTVWLFDSQQNRYENGKYLGRGTWKETPIESETRASFVVNNLKFDKKTGIERARSGYSATIFIYGQIDREDRSWRENSWLIADAVKRCDDVGKLKQIASIIEWVKP